jgi:flagellar hook-associated protein 2
MSIKTDGVISGMKTSALVSELSSAISKPKLLLERKVNLIGARQSAYAALNTKLKALNTSLEDIQDLDDFRDFTATTPSTADDYFTVTSDGTATAGTYSIQTTNLAKSEIWVMNPFAEKDSDDKINSGTFSITWSNTSTTSGYDPITVQVSEANGNNTLSTLASALDKKDGVTSYVMYDGTTYRLVIQGEDTGDKYKFNVNMNTTGTTTGTDLDPTAGTVSNTDAADASLLLNGIAITSTTNTFDDAVEGLTIKAVGDMATDSVGALNTTVTLDTSAVSDKINAFVTAYNEVIEFVKVRSKYDADKGIKGIFVGDASARNIINRVRTVVIIQYSDLLTANDEDVFLDSLSLLGVEFSTNNDGKLTFDSTAFLEALEDNQFDIEAMFSDDENSFSTAMTEALDEYVDPLTGIIKKLDTNLDTQVDALEDQIERWETRITSYEARLFKQFTAMEKIAGRMQTTSTFLTSFFTPATK